MSGEEERLVAEALRARERAYAPYSSFRVGAALVTVDGELFLGANVENASHGASVCAERVAVYGAVSSGRTRFRAIAVVAEGAPCVPCGICRQVLSEFSEDMEVLCANTEGELVTYRLRALLPAPFTLERGRED